MDYKRAALALQRAEKVLQRPCFLHWQRLTQVAGKNVSSVFVKALVRGAQEGRAGEKQH